ncbi:dihydrofolate reductase [Limnoglobus roseus]|uniref:Dihydrofolate reductase n=2 Tax=Limnoglobus roseus TaxID=2598579 RepID=A0A5C1AQV4_9BACT|nr:dihydrofolate reductase [Limnoglobus roseus]
MVEDQPRHGDWNHNEKDQDIRARLAGWYHLNRKRRLHVWRLDGTLPLPNGGSSSDRDTGQRLRSSPRTSTYDLWSSYWPKIKGSPFAESINAATKYVATYRPESLEWGPIGNLGSDALEGVRTLKSSDGPDLLVWGSTVLTATLFEQGLVDGVTLVTYPVLIGQGKRFFSETAARELAFISTKTSPTGALLNTYRHVGPLRMLK